MACQKPQTNREEVGAFRPADAGSRCRKSGARSLGRAFVDWAVPESRGSSRSGWALPGGVVIWTRVTYYLLPSLTNPVNVCCLSIPLRETYFP